MLKTTILAAAAAAVTLLTPPSQAHAQARGDPSGPIAGYTAGTSSQPRADFPRGSAVDREDV